MFFKQLNWFNDWNKSYQDESMIQAPYTILWVEMQTGSGAGKLTEANTDMQAITDMLAHRYLRLEDHHEMTGTYLNTITRRLCWGLSASRMRGAEGLLSPSTCGTARPRMTRLKRIWALRFLWLKDRRERRGSMTVYAYLCVPRNQGTPVEEDRTKNQQLLTSLRVQILAGNCRRHSLYHFLLVQCCQ